MAMFRYPSGVPMEEDASFVSIRGQNGDYQEECPNNQI